MTGHDCTGCDLGRRHFLRDAAVGTALAAFASAVPLEAIEAIERRGNEVAYAIPAKDGVSIDKKNDTMVARVGAKVFVFARNCPHQNTALRWLDGQNRFQCPKHESKYTPDGVFIEGRATRGLDRFAVKKAGGNVVAELDKLYQEDTDAADWKAAFIEA
jgi:Rieske Fe-S protein